VNPASHRHFSKTGAAQAAVAADASLTAPPALVRLVGGVMESFKTTAESYAKREAVAGA
jgi:hypothetical protein